MVRQPVAAVTNELSPHPVEIPVALYAVMVTYTFVLFGKVGNNPVCHHRALDLAEKGIRERVVKVKAAPGLPFDYSIFEIIEEAFPEEERARYLELAHASMKRPPKAAT